MTVTGSIRSLKVGIGNDLVLYPGRKEVNRLRWKAIDYAHTVATDCIVSIMERNNCTEVDELMLVRVNWVNRVETWASIYRRTCMFKNRRESMVFIQCSMKHVVYLSK